MPTVHPKLRCHNHPEAQQHERPSLTAFLRRGLVTTKELIQVTSLRPSPGIDPGADSRVDTCPTVG
uniref:Uncharacterized protein n=1 Tax=Physcomitrium patens TaxID=3218 RepID=A0A2K1L926_PHYPA|nr:hypothetical protein PHYPA_000964 [Physcomitrium patens]